MSAKDHDLRRKRVEVSAWLSDLLGPESVPDFEINAQTVELLHQLSGISRFNEGNALVCLEDLQKKAEEYNADAQRVGSISRKLMLGQASFSQPSLACLQALAQTGAVLNVRDPSDTSYALCLQDLHSRVNEVFENVLVQGKDTHRQSRKMQDVLIKHSLLQKALDAVEKRATKDAAQNVERKEETVLLRRKTEDNETKIAKLKMQLAKTGVDEEDLHANLVKKGEKLGSLENELNPLKAELQSYTSLPPDPVKAKVEIEQLKRKLYQLQAQMTECVDINLT